MSKKIWVIVGTVCFLVGAALFWQSYLKVTECNSLLSKISTFLGAMFGGQVSPMACTIAQISEIFGILLAIMGLVVVFFGLRDKSK